MANEFFFVGNTLHEEKLRKNLQPFILQSQSVFVKGSLYRDEIGFVYLSELGSEFIKGELISFGDSLVLEPFIDSIFDFRPNSPQRGLNIKKQIDIFDENNVDLKKVNAYILNPAKTNKLKLVQGNDWRDAFKTSPCYLENLSEPQVTYLTKLSSSSGRDIVPINMPLYRELMKLNLIVDKGRRLALSPLGKQVCSYLNTQSKDFSSCLLDSKEEFSEDNIIESI